MASVDNSPASEKPKILLVDDREDNLLSIEAILEPDGYQFLRAYSGQQALKILLNEFDFAMILMDVKMPVLNGFETAALIYERERLRHIPIIFITANNYGDENIFKGYKSGGIDYIFKPINPEVLRAKVAIFIDIYRKNVQLIGQEQELLSANRTLENEIKLLNESKAKAKQLNVRLEKEIADLALVLVSSKIANDHFKFEESDLNGLIKTLIADMEDQVRQKMATVLIEPLPMLWVSRVLMRPLFQQLIQSTLESGQVAPVVNIRAEVGLPADVSNSKSSRNHDYCQIIVEDNGADRRQQGETLIALERNGDYGNINKGLALCKMIMERHHGFIHAKNNKGDGTTFVVSFPIAK